MALTVKQMELAIEKKQKLMDANKKKIEELQEINNSLKKKIDDMVKLKKEYAELEIRISSTFDSDKSKKNETINDEPEAEEI